MGELRSQCVMNTWPSATAMLPGPAANLEPRDLLSSGVLLLSLTHCFAEMDSFNLLSATAMFVYSLGRLRFPGSHG